VRSSVRSFSGIKKHKGGLNMQNRLRSKALWTSILALMLFVSKTYFNYEIEEGDRLVDTILLILTLAGIFNNPTNNNKF